MAGKKDRQRQLARERLARQQARRTQQAHKARVRAIITGAVCVVAALAVGGYFLFGTGGGKSAAATPSTSPSATASASATSSAAAVSEPAHSCTYTKSGTAARTVKLPSATPDYKATYQTTIVTNRGTIVIDLAQQQGHLHGQFVRVTGQAELLQQHQMPPAHHERDLRAAVRRPDRVRVRAARVMRSETRT